MTTAELVKILAERLAISQRQARTLLDAYIDAVSHQLSEGNTVILRNFGSFDIKTVAEKLAYVPGKKTRRLIPARNKLHFKAAKKLREEVNEADTNE